MHQDRSSWGSELRRLHHLSGGARRSASIGSVLFVAGSALAAQTIEPPSTGSIRGIVRGEMSRLLPDAEIFLGSDSTGTRNGSNATFRFTRVAEGNHWLFVRRIGYAPTRRLISVVGGQELAVEVRLEPLPFNLPEIEVEARSGYRDFAHFTQRTRNAWGHSVSEEQISRLGGRKLSALIQPRLPWQATSWFDQARRRVVELTDYSGAPYWDRRRAGPATFYPGAVGSGGDPTGGWFGVRYPLTGSDRPSRRPFTYGTGIGPVADPGTLAVPQGFGTGCAPAVSINGRTPSLGTNLDDIDPNLVASMEIYEPKQLGGRVPADFADDAWVESCGLVVVWSR